MARVLCCECASKTIWYVLCVQIPRVQHSSYIFDIHIFSTTDTAQNPKLISSPISTPTPEKGTNMPSRHAVNDDNTYFPFLELFGPAVVGKNKWKRHRRHRPFGKCLTVSDEAFIILCYENFKLVWVEQYWQDSTAISSKVCVIFVLWNIWCLLLNNGSTHTRPAEYSYRKQGMCYFCLVEHMMAAY